MYDALGIEDTDLVACPDGLSLSCRAVLKQLKKN